MCSWLRNLARRGRAGVVSSKRETLAPAFRFHRPRRARARSRSTGAFRSFDVTHFLADRLPLQRKPLYFNDGGGARLSRGGCRLERETHDRYCNLLGPRRVLVRCCLDLRAALARLCGGLCRAHARYRGGAFFRARIAAKLRAGPLGRLSEYASPEGVVSVTIVGGPSRRGLHKKMRSPSRGSAAERQGERGIIRRVAPWSRARATPRPRD